LTILAYLIYFIKIMKESKLKNYIPALILVALVQTALSIVTTWNPANNNWNAAGNWSSGTPGAADEAKFNSALVFDPVVNAPSSVGQINFAAGAATHTITSNTIFDTLTINGIGGNLITNSSGNTQNVNAHVVLGASGNINATAGNLSFNSSVGFNLNGYNATFSGLSDITVNTAILGTGNITKIGTNTLNLNGDNSGATFTLTVNGGTTNLNHVNSTTVNTNLVVNDGTVNINAGVFIGSLSGTGGLINNNGWSPAIGGNNASTVYSGTISGSGGLVKQGSGTLTLTNPQTYTAGTQIDGGTLALYDTADTGGVTVNNGANLVLDVNGQLTQATGITLNPGGTLLITATNSATNKIPDDATFILAGGTLINNSNIAEEVGGLTLDDNSTITLNSTPGNNGGWIFNDFYFYNGINNGNSFNPVLTINNSFAGPLTSAGTNDKIIFKDISNVDPDFLANVSWTAQGIMGATFIPFGSHWELVPIPEPSTYAAIIIISILGIGLHIRRRKQQAVASV
jgi:autotransporter-associated beta strand protein